MVFHWSLSDSKSPQVSRTLLSILAVLNNAVVWIVSTRPPTSKSSSPFSNPLVTVPNASIGIIVTCMLRVFCSSVSCWSFTGVWVIASLFRSPGFFSVFWLILIMLSFRWSLLVLLFPSNSSPFVNPLVTVLSTRIIIGIIFTFMFQSFFQFPSKAQVIIIIIIIISKSVSVHGTQKIVQKVSRMVFQE